MRAQSNDNYFTELYGGSEAGSYLRRIDSCITQRKAQGPCRTCSESNEEKRRALTSEAGYVSPMIRFRGKREQLKRCEGLSPESQCHNLALILVYSPSAFDSGSREIDVRVTSPSPMAPAREKRAVHSDLIGNMFHLKHFRDTLGLDLIYSPRHSSTIEETPHLR